MENMKTTHGGIPIPIPGRLNILISLAAFSFALHACSEQAYLLNGGKLRCVL
jgi:hypothetical protein